MLQLLSAVDHLHQNFIIHRLDPVQKCWCSLNACSHSDLKLSNLLMNSKANGIVSSSQLSPLTSGFVLGRSQAG